MSGKAEKGRLKKYRNGYGKYGACVITGFALYGLAETAGKMVLKVLTLAMINISFKI